jgi:hypothetical protein
MDNWYKFRSLKHDELMSSIYEDKILDEKADLK